MNNKKSIISLMIIILIMFQNVASIANVIDIGESSLIKRGDLGFYSVQYWNEEKQIWTYIIYSQTYYIDKNGDKRIAYCVNPDLKGVGWISGETEQCEANITEKLNNVKLWRVYKYGYPRVSPEELGVETSDDAYLATKQAAYCVIKGMKEDEVYDYYRAGQTEINNQNLEETKEMISDGFFKVLDVVGCTVCGAIALTVVAPAVILTETVKEVAETVKDAVSPQTVEYSPLYEYFELINGVFQKDTNEVFEFSGDYWYLRFKRHADIFLNKKKYINPLYKEVKTPLNVKTGVQYLSIWKEFFYKYINIFI